EVNRLAKYIHSEYPQLKTAWYSGRSEIHEDIEKTSFDYIKLGGYVASLGGLRSETTNQRLYKIENGEMTVMKFQSKNFAGSDVK
ncbi:MAG: anaerobic ribonucleoside-triphosphate reductase activating protein, partial [Candidatus Kapabacteria bacterium]|nr:anaerobic ribonucleoside-triphosphate reductase activating protein [Candidatus Kapabacteria bacterium]